MTLGATRRSFDIPGVLLLVLLSLLILLSLLAIKRGIADILHRSAQLSINHWTNTGILPDGVRKVEEVESWLLLALRLEPSDPSLNDNLGRLYSLATNLPGIPYAERRRYGGQAMESFRVALRLRPSHPYTWVNLALIKGWLGQVFDKEFQTAFRKGIDNGPWEPELQRALMRLGFEKWPWLDDGLRAAVFLTVDHAMKVQPENVFKLAETAGQLPLICDHLTDRITDRTDETRKRCAKVKKDP
ncbi:MAG: hypothetical protein KJ675_16985 [Gammaproteobacteria bacterium]|nr:hypothetical protein [Gammaproteobacteria bacterium]